MCQIESGVGRKIERDRQTVIERQTQKTERKTNRQTNREFMLIWCLRDIIFGSFICHIDNPHLFNSVYVHQ